ncbi:9120_t:CDS:2 [Ambispora leptoticha]|uniref:9120_t:CDS:1 n=1 Tax=Ambispora leptoticha TaxID=144679 RepID=A0A9N9GZE7_9GLOM|nr:9120_t:CDS:2 [Ambispora leptoticha]
MTVSTMPKTALTSPSSTPKKKNSTLASKTKTSNPVEIAEPISPNCDLMAELNHVRPERTAQLIGKSKLDQITQQPLNNQQTIFRRYDYQNQITTYFYRTHEKLPAKQPVKKFTFSKKPKKPAVQHDFQEFLITRLLLLCSKAEFLHLPLEQERVFKENENAMVVRSFIAKLDTYAQEYDLEESQAFYAYPITHDQQHETMLQLGGTCPCDPARARNQYLNN